MQHRAGFAVFTVALLSCNGDKADTSDFIGSELTQAIVPASSTNARADNAAAAALGRLVFLDPGFSSDGTVGCVNCHDPASGFSDAKPRSVGVRGQTGDRHSMPITAAVMHPFLFWDGRADSPWLQPLKALENPKEMAFSRVEVARRITTTYAAAYTSVFGAIPDLSAAPERALPGDDAWNAMPASLQDTVNRVFVNTGKALEAYERTVLCIDTRFDRWLRGQEQLSGSELAGGATFRQSHCNRCHSGPSFSDGKFHDLGLALADRGRVLGAAELLGDPLNGAGAYSDDPTAGAAKLAAVKTETAEEGSFRTASLRGVGQRTYFGHAATEKTLRDFITNTYRRGRNNRRATVGTRDPLLDDVNVDGDDIDDLVAFLRTLDCPTTAQ